jgi:tRNA modification GTPase
LADPDKKFSITQPHLFISGKTGYNLDALQQMLLESVQLPDARVSDTVVTNIRHYTALTNIIKAIENVQQGILNGVSTDLLAVDIHVALHQMGEITGEVTNDEILGNIFSQFCIGK